MPQIIKTPIVRVLQKKDIDIYRAPIISKRAGVVSVEPEHYSICADSVNSDLKKFESLTKFDTTHWSKLLLINHD